MTGTSEPAPDINHAVAAYQAGQFADAERICQRLIAAQHDHFDALHLIAVIQAASGGHELALASYDRALAVRPDHADALSNRGNTLLALGRVAQALASYQRALAVRPDYPEALSNLGSALERLDRLEDALESYDRALALRPDFVNALYNRGNVLKKLARYDEALATYDRVLALRPGHADAHNNRGQALRELARYDEALAAYDRAIALQQHHVMARCNSSALRLLTGDFERGWFDYEWRWLKPSVAGARRTFAQPMWLGEALAGKTILLHAEQGLGDTIQFCRYVPLVALRGARVVLEVQAGLYPLLRELPGAAQVVVKGGTLPGFDLHCPLLSLPLVFGTRLDTIPAAKAYLRAPAQPAMQWQARLADKHPPRVGLAWSGNPAHERDRERSVALQALLPLLDAEATFVSLQKELRAEDAGMLQQCSDILRYGGELKDFADTAALIAQLDLVISVDTSVAHLAGALGKPVWILLTHFPDWRWLIGRDDSPWYPSARLFRQDAARRWEPVIARVAAALREFIQAAQPAALQRGLA